MDSLFLSEFLDLMPGLSIEQDIMHNRSIKDALAAEERFFHTHPVWLDFAAHFIWLFWSLSVCQFQTYPIGTGVYKASWSLWYPTIGKEVEPGADLDFVL